MTTRQGRNGSRIACIGECMLEISPRGNTTEIGDLPAVVGYGGDTLNTAVYLARLGVDTEFVTALGDDPWSDWMLAQWRHEGVRCSLVARIPETLPGLYSIVLDEHGERSFYYWRSQSAARQLLDDATRAQPLLTGLAACDLVYLSGITLAILPQQARELLFRWLGDYRQSGGLVAFDGNYRPRLWENADVARSNCDRAWALADIALPTFDDEQLLHGDSDPSVTVARLQELGGTEICIKNGATGCLLVAGSSRQLVTAEPVSNVRDTTAAGDSFNAGYLGGRMTGQSPEHAAMTGHRLAAAVIQHPGAIIDRQLVVPLAG